MLAVIIIAFILGVATGIPVGGHLYHRRLTEFEHGVRLSRAGLAKASVITTVILFVLGILGIL